MVFVRSLPGDAELWCSDGVVVWPALPGGRTLAWGDGRPLLLHDGACSALLRAPTVLLLDSVNFWSGRLSSEGRIVRVWLPSPGDTAARAVIDDRALARILESLARAEGRAAAALLGNAVRLLDLASPTRLPAPVLPANLRLAVRHLVAHADRLVSLDEAAAAARSSKFYLSRLARRFLGASLHDVAVRLRTAGALMALRARRPLRDAAAAAGFADQPHLTRVFRRELGLTPGQYARVIAQRCTPRVSSPRPPVDGPPAR